MSKKVLILSTPVDIHAFAIREALERKGARPVLWFTSDFPRLESETITFEGNAPRLKVNGSPLGSESWDFAAVWHRRPTSAPDTEILHPADRSYAQYQCNIFRRSLWQLLLPGAFWVNPPLASAQASEKILQHHAALQCGLDTPDTIFSNDPAEVRRFMRSHGGSIVFKPLGATGWRDDKTDWIPFTVELDESKLADDDIIRQTPAIFQELVPKAYELRVTFMGHACFAAKLHSQDTQKGRLDWRKSYDELKMEVTDLPAVVQEKCRALMRRLSICFGCFDFIVTPDERYIFLEVNEMGQFLFIEMATGLQLTDAFANFLLSGKPDFTWKNSGKQILFADMEDEVTARMKESSPPHVHPIFPHFYEGPGK